MDLTGYFIHAPLSALYALLIAFSMVVVFDETGRYVCRQDKPWIRAAYYFSGLLFTSWLILLISIFGLVSVALLNCFAAFFILTSAVLLISKRRIPLPFNIGAAECRFSKIIRLIVYVVLISVFIISLAPPTDADSLNYHLGIPVEVLRTGSLWFNKDLLQYRMVGLGEMLNMLGVANGCPQLGAVLQVVGLCWVLYVFAEAVDPKLNTAVYALTLGVPVMLFLIPNQKHQLTGTLCTSLCFYVLTFRNKDLNGRLFILFSLLMIFAIGIKYSFLFSAVVLLLLMLLKRKELYLSSAAIGYAILFGFILLGPLYIYKILHYNDPLPPFFEFMKNDADPVVIGFAKSIKDYYNSAFPFPLNLFIPSSVGNISTVLGWAGVIILLFIVVEKKDKKERIALFCFILLTIFAGQKTSRFFLEPYLWIVPIIVTKAAKLKFEKVVITIGQVQLLLITPLFVYGAYILIPGLLSDKGREQILQHYAHEYNEAMWVNRIIPDNKTVATFTPSRAFINRKTFPLEYLSLVFEEDSARQERARRMFREYGVSYIVLHPQQAKMLKNKFQMEQVAGPVVFEKATRNPRNIRKYILSVYKLH